MFYESKLSDSEIITISLVGEAAMIASEKPWFNFVKSNLPMFKCDDIRIIDSMPIPVCKFARSYFSKSFKDISTYGHCASKKETYFGLKLHS